MQQTYHREITEWAVRHMFRELGARHVRGLGKADYTRALDRAQRRQDAVFDRKTILGPAALSAGLNRSGQRAHAMADPGLDGSENLRLIKQYLVDQLREAMSASDVSTEIRHLGAAAHAVQDSYSSAHMWRSDEVYTKGSPEASVQSINVFRLLPGKHTHAYAFDRAGLDTGSGRAAAMATKDVLVAYERSRSAEDRTAAHAYQQLAERLLPEHAAGVRVNDTPDAAWKKEMYRRLGLHRRPDRVVARAGREQEPNRRVRRSGLNRALRAKARRLDDRRTEHDGHQHD